MIYLPELEPLTRCFARLAYEPLTVTAQLVPNAQVVAYDPIYLDGLLAWSVIQQATQGRGVAPTHEAYWIPLPLEAAAFIDGLPLWKASIFAPQGATWRDVHYLHRRSIAARHSRVGNLVTNMGRWMEQRMPIPALLCETDRWTARCIGHAESIRELLNRVQFLGKHRRVGFGEVRQWIVEPCAPSDPFVQEGRLTHAIPAHYPHRYNIDEPPVLVGWTPPHWKPDLFAAGWPVGTEVTLR